MQRLIKVSNLGMVAGRITPIVTNFFRILGRDYEINDNFDMDQNFAYWFIEMLPTINNAEEFINSKEQDFLNYRGKLIFYSLADHAGSSYDWLKKSILNRVDVWFVNSMFPNNMEKRNKYICEDIQHKYIQLPKYNIFPPVETEFSVKENKIFFVGFSHNNRHNRVMPVKILRNNNNLSTRFVGGIYSTEPIEATYFHDLINEDKNFIYEMGKYKISLCPPGNSIFCVRHIESMAVKNSIISVDLRLDNEDWLYQELLNEYLYIYNEDLSNFKQVCEYSLNNENETNYRAIKLHEIYKAFFELNEDLSYKDHTWLPIQHQLHTLGIYT